MNKRQIPYSQESLQGAADIRAETNSLPRDLLRACRLPLIDAGIGGAWILRRHLPKGIFDDPRGVLFIAHRMSLCSRSRSNSCFCKQLRISAKPRSLQVFAIHRTDFSDEAVMNVHPHNNLPVYHFFFINNQNIRQMKAQENFTRTKQLLTDTKKEGSE